MAQVTNEDTMPQATLIIPNVFDMYKMKFFKLVKSIAKKYPTIEFCDGWMPGFEYHDNLGDLRTLFDIHHKVGGVKARGPKADIEKFADDLDVEFLSGPQAIEDSFHQGIC